RLRPASTIDKESTQDAKDWFASKKRALLAPFGVGTVDQALMSIIAVKHFFVRQFALAGKVIILDEVHSYDLYTGTLIKTLCEKLLPLGCTILILSATLTRKTKKGFIDRANDCDDKVYPLITGKEYGEEQPLFVPVEKPEEKNVQIYFKNEANALSNAIEKAVSGASVLWVCDTVQRAQEMYHHAVLSESKVELGLIHARFPVFRRQELEGYWMEKKLGKDGAGRSGCILFSTQVVEQSVDLDADFMVSELAPTDMLLQRMGRLWRHNRTQRPCERPEFCIVAENNQFNEFKNFSADKIKKMFGTKAKVYTPYVLLRSFELWRNKESVNLPNDIHDLLEQTYMVRDNEPEGWQKLLEEIEGENFAKKNSADFEANMWNPLLNDEEGIAKTRINNYSVTQMILIKKKEGTKIILLNGEVAELRNVAVSLVAARAIHRNIVKIPAYCFSARTENQDISALVCGDWQLGIVKDNGNIKNQNLKSDYTLKYTPEKGVEIIRNKTESEVDNEPCD
ncbi:MAG: CRISPR-associated helicase Cas3', partial [Candidatus Omnitrophica bacterium]|nr:CRISPR-associated helicase Cas3' [Candidatus Omnitrophota bacterium]